MKQSEAVRYLETMLYASQKTRSNMVDKNWGLVKDLHDASDPLAQLLPKLYPTLLSEDDRMMEALIRTLERCGRGEPLGPQTFYNLMLMAEKEPAIKVMAALTWNVQLPSPDIKWMAGWEPEDAEKQ